MTNYFFLVRSSLVWTVLLLGLGFSDIPQAMSYDIERPEIRDFINSMHARHGFDTAWLESLLTNTEYKKKIIETMQRPAEKTLNWSEYRHIFMTEERIDAGVAFWKDHETELTRISEDSGVSGKIIVGIIGVESYFGRITGNYRVMDALSTLAFDYPPRAEFFRSELEHFLLLSREENANPLDATGSYAGAMGIAQFMPSSYRAYAVDANADGKRDIWGNWSDVIGSIANYLSDHGWQAGQPVAACVTETSPGIEYYGRQLKMNETISGLRDKGLRFESHLPGSTKVMLVRLSVPDRDRFWVGFNNFYVITRYNHSMMYAMAVYQLGIGIEERLTNDET